MCTNFSVEMTIHYSYLVRVTKQFTIHVFHHFMGLSCYTIVIKGPTHVYYHPFSVQDSFNHVICSSASLRESMQIEERVVPICQPLNHAVKMQSKCDDGLISLSRYKIQPIL